MKIDPRSTLEREFDANHLGRSDLLTQLIRILKYERDVMRDNWIASEKYRIKTEQQLQAFQQRKPWRIFRSLCRLATKHDLEEMEQRFKMTQKELSEKLDAQTKAIGDVGDQLKKATTEITTEIQNLKDAVAAGPVSDAVSTAMANLDAKIAPLQSLSQALDDLNPDAAPPA